MNNIIRSMFVAINLGKLTQIVNYNTDLKQQVADLHQQLAAALANDAADAQAIADAQEKASQAMAEAQAAKDAVAPLQAAVDADASEDEQANALIDSVTLPDATPEAITEVPVI